MESVLGKTVYLVFECVWLEDGINPEYSFVNGSESYTDALTFLSELKKGYLSEYNKIIQHKINYDEKSYPLFWNPEMCIWMNKGAFMSISPQDILTKCNVR